jgi:glycosyltransferase involved in cell wall biosynthesis
MVLVKQQESLPEPSNQTGNAPHRGRSGHALHICMVAYAFYESDNRVMRYAETLAKEGHDVEVFALQDGCYPTEEVMGGVKVRRLQARVKNEKSRLAYLWPILSFLWRSFYRVSVNDLGRRYDLVHVHSVPDFLVFSALLPRLRGTPVILDIHDILPEFYGGKFGVGKDSLIFRILCWTEWVCAKFSSHVIIANHIWRERLLSRSVGEDKCSVVMNSPDRSIFYPSETPLPKRDRFVLLYPGSLNWHQGVDIAIRAFAKISEQVPFADFHIYGQGPSQGQLLLLIEELGLDGRVVLHEIKKLREVPGMMENADLGIVPKRKENFGNEAFSTKILEFMAMKVPVVVSDTRIDRYYFDDSIVRFFEGGNDDDLACCMLDLIQHPEKRQALVTNASEFVAKNDWTVKKYEYLALVQRLTSAQNQ